MTGALPPSSRGTRLSDEAAARATSLPVARTRARGAGEEAKAVGDGRDLLRPGRCERLADVLRLELGELVAVRLDRLGQLEQALAAVARRGVRPTSLESLAGSGHGAIDVLFAALWHVRDDLAGGGVDDLLIAASRTGRPPPVDEHLVTSQRRAHGFLPYGFKDAPRMSSPSSRCSSEIVSGISVRMTL